MATTIIQDKSKKILADLSSNRVTLLDGRFYYDDKGNPIPSVTTILDAYPKGPAFYEWLKTYGKESDEIMNAAGRRGSRIHDITERYDNGEKIELINENMGLEMSMNEWAMFERYVDFTTRFDPVHEVIEQNVISSKIGAAGTVDRVSVIKMWKKKLIIDIKTSPTIYDHFWIQLVTYKKIMEDLKFKGIDGVAILHLNAKIRTQGKGDDICGEGWKLYQLNPDEELKNWELFQSTKNLWYAQNGSLVPKNTSYSLSHQKPKPKKK